MKLSMAIRIEQLDINNISKYFLLQTDFKDLLVSTLGAMTDDEKNALGIGGSVIPEKSQLKSLIDACNTLVTTAIPGFALGQYYQKAIDDFKTAIATATEALTASIQTMVDATNTLFAARTVFNLSQVTANGVLSGGKWYGLVPLADNSYPWVPVKVFNGTYWVSTEAIDPYHPVANELVQLYGVYVPSQNNIYTRFGLPSNILGQGAKQVEGALYGDIWFGSNQQEADILSTYLGRTIDLIVSDYEHVDANPPVIPVSGDAWYGRNEDMQFLPPTSDECTRIMNIVAALGTDQQQQPSDGPSHNTTITSILYTVDQTNHTISNIPDGKTVTDVIGALTIPTGATVALKNTSGVAVTSGPVADNFVLNVTAEDGVSVATYTLYVNDVIVTPTDPSAPVTIGNNYYSITPPPAGSNLNWIPTKIVGKTFISMAPIPLAFPNASTLSSLVGTYVPATNTVYTRHQLSQDCVDAGIKKEDGALYNSIWFGANDVSNTMTGYLGTTVYYVQSAYKHVDANPPLIPVAGDAWYGSSDYLSFLPQQVTDLNNIFNCVAAFGQ
jgi:hypothetical protein